MKKTVLSTLFTFLLPLGICLAADLNVSGTMNASAGVTAGTYFYTAYGYLYVGNYGYFNNYVQSPSGLFNQISIGPSTATGTYASGFGSAANATSYSSMVVGRNNVTTASDGTAANAGAWVDKDPLFTVGNGTGVSGTNQYRNAFTVFKDGTITMSKVQGDILMGVYGN